MTHHATQTLQGLGYRLTPQRTLVWDVLRQSHDHLGADEICLRVQKDFPHVNISTVYRTLELLVELDLVRETHLGPNRRYYEVEEGEPHHHLVCTDCGSAMHIPDGFIDTTTAAATGAVSLGALAYAVRRTDRDLGERTVPLLGVTGAFVFAAQMLNFPVAAGTSGHLLGAMLAAVLLGPWAAVIVMSVVLVVQALAMADGGITALGANILNVAILG